MKKIIFLNSFLPRTGHNFTADVIKIFSDHEVLAHGRSETRLSTVLDYYYRVRMTASHESDKDFLDSLFVKDLRERILSRSGNPYIMIKDTSVIGMKFLPHVFPNDIHILLIRDPKDVFSSLFKAMNLSDKTWRNRAKKMGISTGIYPYYYSRKLSNSVEKNFPQIENFFVIRYEDLFLKEEETLKALKKLFKCEKELELIIKEIDAIPVYNSSFYEETGAKKIWEKKPKTSNFNPIRRKVKILQEKGIELGSRKFRRRLKYI